MTHQTIKPTRMTTTALLSTMVMALFVLLMLNLPAFADSPSHQTETIISASEYDYPPFCSVDKNNQATGFSVELLRATLQAMGREVTFSVGPWSEVKQRLTDGTVQVLPLVGRTPEREDLYDFTVPYMTMHGTLVVRSETSQIKSLDDLAGKHLAVMAGDNAEEFVRRNKLGGTVTTTETFDLALQRLSAGEFDAVVIQKLLATQLINQYQIDNLKFAGPPLESFVQSFCFAVPKGDARLLSLLNEGLSIVIADGTLSKLREKWFASLEGLRKNHIVIGGDYNYPPYEYLDENGQPTGYNVELTRAIAKHLGLSVEIQLGPWGTILEKLENGNIDLVQGMFYSPERAKFFNFTDAHTRIRHVAVARAETALVTDMGQLTGKRIVVMNGDIMHDLAVKEGHTQQLVVTETQMEALQLVAEGQADYALLAREPALYWIQKNKIADLHVGTVALATPEYCYASTRQNNYLLKEFSLGLLDLNATGEYRSIHQKWLGLYENQGLSVKSIIRYALYVAIPLLVLLALSILWVRTLKRQVRDRTVALQREAKHARESETLFRTLVNTIPELIWLKDADGFYLACNNRFERFLGVPEAEILGKTDYDFVDKDLADSFRHYDGLAIAKHSSNCNEEWVYFADDGDRCLLETTKVPMYDNAQNLIGVLGIARDITSEKAKDLALEEMDRLKNEFISTAAHELRTPLTAMMGFTELMLNPDLSAYFNEEQRLEYLHDVYSRGEALDRLIDDLLDVSRIESGKQIPLERQQIYLAELLTRAMKFLRIAGSGHVFRLELPEDSAGKTHNIDQHRVNQMIENLLSNAVKYSPQGTEIVITGEAGHDGWTVRVEDKGIGMTAEQVRQVFNKFYRANASNTAVSGLGLGMSIVKQIVDAHRGSIAVESVLGEGTTVTFYLPYESV